MAAATAAADAHADFGMPERLVDRVRAQLHARAVLGPLSVLVLSIVVFAVVSDHFFAFNNFSLILQQSMVVATIGIGQTLVVLTSGVDLAVGSTMTISMMAMAKLSAGGTNGVLALLIGFVVGLVCGALIGFFVTRFRLQPFIVTLAALYVYKALELWYSRSANVRGTDISPVLKWTGNTIHLGTTQIPYGAIIMLAAFAAMAYALRQTAWGRHVYATGDDRESARLAGIRTNRVLLSVYLLCGLFCALAGWILIGRNQGGDPQAVTKDYNLDSIVAVVIGGTSLFGGRGRILGTLIGALTIGVFRSGLPLAGVSDIWKDFAIGVLILAAVLIDQWVRKVAR